MPQIIPIKDLKNTSEISELCHKAEEPIYITKNGYGDMVIMSIECYDGIYYHIQMNRDLEVAEDQIIEAKVKDASACVALMRERYEL